MIALSVRQRPFRRNAENAARRFKPQRLKSFGIVYPQSQNVRQVIEAFAFTASADRKGVEAWIQRAARQLSAHGMSTRRQAADSSQRVGASTLEQKYIVTRFYGETNHHVVKYSVSLKLERHS